MSNAEKIVDSELEVMKLLWASGEPVGLSEIIAVLTEKLGWKEPTVKTVVRNLRLKGAIEQVGRGTYAAVVTEREYNEFSARSYVNRIFDGSAKKLVATLVSDGQLTEDEVAELLEALRGGKNG